MAESASRQDEANPTFWSATKRAKWVHIAIFSFRPYNKPLIDRDLVLLNKKNKKELSQYPASRLVNNAYLADKLSLES